MNNKLSPAFALILLATVNCLPITSTSTVAKTNSGKAATKKSALSPAQKAHKSFDNGTAGAISPAQLVAAKVFTDYPLIGGTYARKEPINYIVLHSTETATKADGKRVIRSWNNRGKNHPGAQYVVDRDGTIYQTVSPEIVTMHVNAFKTRYGVGNKNSIGIEIVRCGNQKYTPIQLKKLTSLCLYLQQRFEIPNDNVLAHSFVQPDDRRDPVDFDWKAFNMSKTALAMNAQEQNRSSSTDLAGVFTSPVR